ncbi:MAG: integrase [Gammaproteobacteria bacterium]|nr:MAG: integrase [Gammaproteobacteria bacterium]
MSTPIDLRAKVDDYLAERRRLGFKLRNMALALASFASYAEHVGHQGPLTTDVMADWSRLDKAQGHSLGTSARRLKVLRPFTRWLRQFEPRTEVPDASIFGPVPGRVAPHIYREAEIVELLAAARGLNPQGGLRPATFETLFGLIASAGLRVSEALSLLDTDVDLSDSTLMVRQTKFAKSRLLPLHPSTVEVLIRYRQLRSRQVPATADTPFFVGTRGRRLGQPLSDRQVHRVFNELRGQLSWVNRGAHDNPRIHDLRHSFAVRRLMLWHEQGIDVDQAMLALSTYLGHAKISNTYWYLTGVPELMALAGSKFERFVEAAEADDE